MDTVLIDGAARPDLAAAITRYEVRDSLTRASTCALEFVSLGPEFVWVDSPLLANGVHVELRRASGVQPERRLFAGRITVVIARFPTSTTPHVEVRAESARHADGPPALPLIIHWGAELQEFETQLAGAIEGKGVVSASVELHSGQDITIGGVGTRFSGTYRAGNVVHSFTPEAGSRTYFECRRIRV